MRAFHFDIQRVAQLGRSPHMINMSMGDQDAFHLNLFMLQHLENLRHIPTRIDHDPLAGFFIPNQRAILLKGRHWNNRNLHDGVLSLWRFRPDPSSSRIVSCSTH